MRYYNKKELIDAYTDGRFSRRAGYRWLQNEIKRFPGLLETLTTLGYTEGQRSLTQAQVRAIVEALGEP